jgi:hypothetical protein
MTTKAPDDDDLDKDKDKENGNGKEKNDSNGKDKDKDKVNSDDDLDFLPAMDKLSKDIREAITSLSEREARYLVDVYYQMQEDRKRSANQTRAGEEAEEPSGIVLWLAKQHATLETRIRTILGYHADSKPLGQWARSIVGIGPVIAAGLLAHIDIKKCPTAGHIWSFAGLDPRKLWFGAKETEAEMIKLFGSKLDTVEEEHIIKASNHFHRAVGTIRKFASMSAQDVARVDVGAEPVDTSNGGYTWEKLKKALSRQPHNAKLKVLCWKLGESFVKVSGKDNSFYGKLYKEYRAEEDARNDRGEYADQAAAKLERFRIGKSTEAYGHYSKGRLPPAHLFARAKRRVVKLFLSHYHEIGYELLHGKKPARPWSIEHGGHTHYIPPPTS